MRFSNVFGVNNLNITAATVALPLDGAAGASAIDTSTLTTLTFSGNESFSIPNGALIVSDPVQLPVKPQSMLTVTLYTKDGQEGFDITSHPGSRTTSWMSFGNLVSDFNITSESTQSLEHWWVTNPSMVVVFVVIN